MDVDTTPLDVFTVRQVRTLDERELQELLQWVDRVPLSREKRNISRDLSDGVAVAEIIRHFFPKLVEIHQYTPSNGTPAKEKNWFHLNRRVFSKLGFELHADVIHGLAQCKPWIIESLLVFLRERIDQHVYGSSTSRETETSRTVPDTARTAVGHQALKKSDMIHKSVVDQQRKQIQEQAKTIDVLTANILKLEHVIHLKDIRIEDLSARLEKAGLKVPPDPSSLAERRPMPGSTRPPAKVSQLHK
jgi:hypothetical protein